MTHEEALKMIRGIGHLAPPENSPDGLIEIEDSTIGSSATVVETAQVFRRCTFLPCGGVFFGRQFHQCRFVGGRWIFENCTLIDCTIDSDANYENRLIIRGGSMRGCRFLSSTPWDSFCLMPDFTEGCTVDDDFMAMDLTIRINCASWGGVTVPRKAFHNFLSGMFYGKKMPNISLDLYQRCRRVWQSIVHSREEDGLDKSPASH